MALPLSGPIRLKQIGEEFLQVSPWRMSEVRGLAGTPGSGPLDFSDFYGKENVNSWNIEASAIHEYQIYGSSTSSITLNWNQATQQAAGTSSEQPYDNDFSDWQAGDLLIVTTKLHNYLYSGGSMYLKPFKFLNAPTGWTRAGHTSGSFNRPTLAIFAKVLTASDISGNGSYSFSISGTATAFEYSFGFSWWRLRKTTASGHTYIYKHSEKSLASNSLSTFSYSIYTPPPALNDGVNGAVDQFTTNSNAFLIGVGHRYDGGYDWGNSTTYTSTELSDMNSNSFSYQDNNINTKVRNFFASIQTWDADTIPDSSITGTMNVHSGLWAWLYTNQ